MDIYNVILSEMGSKRPYGSCVGSYLYLSAARDCMESAIAAMTIQDEDAELERGADFCKITFGNGGITEIHIEKKMLETTPEGKSLISNYLDILNYVSRKLPKELKAKILAFGVKETEILKMKSITFI